MPVCPSCGHDNPDPSRFCANGGAALVQSAGRSAGENAAEVTSTIAIGGIASVNETDDPAASAGAGIDPAALDALAAGTALLVVQRGPNAGSRFLLDADVTTVGRHPDSDIFLDDVTVSRRHAQFRHEGEAFVVSDVGSLNGTYVNRSRIDAAELHGGDEVQIGKYRMVFHASAAPSQGQGGAAAAGGAS